jgi:hypothetical protein
LHLAIVVLKQKAIVDLIRSEPPLLHHACLWLCCPFLKNLEFHPGEAAKRLAERKRSARAASLKSSPVQSRSAPLAAASGLTLAHRLRPANHAFTPGRDSKSNFLKERSAKRNTSPNQI